MKTIMFFLLLLACTSCDLSNGVSNRSYIISQSPIKGENIQGIEGETPQTP